MKISGNIMNIKKILALLVIAVINICIISLFKVNVDHKLTIQYTVKSNQADTYQLFYSQNKAQWEVEKCIDAEYSVPKETQTLTFEIPKDTQVIRMDFGNTSGKVEVSNVSVKYLWKEVDIQNRLLDKDVLMADIQEVVQIDDTISIEKNGEDACIIVDISDLQKSVVNLLGNLIRYFWSGLICIILDVILLVLAKKRKFIFSLAVEVTRNRKLIWNLSKSDFKTKYAGSYLGITWAFVQPIVTVLVYWFVFQVGLRSVPIDNFPYALWLVAGLVPWFFFSEALSNATNSLLEYSYLVKKVVFKISILPVVKLISALFVHVFFIAFTLILFMAYGYMPTAYMLQIIYYTFCIFILVLGLSYITSAIVIFFRDLGQIISIILQVGVWLTPIMWNYSTMSSSKYEWIIKMNPMFYIVRGYRDALIDHIWFWDRPGISIYFWCVTIIIFVIGTVIFKKLKVHFADVL